MELVESQLSRVYLFCVKVVMALAMSDDKKAVPEFKKYLKNSLLIQTGDRANIVVRLVKEKDGELYIIGYCSKDRNKAHYSQWVLGYTDSVIAAAREFYGAKSTSPLRKQRILNQSNLHNEAWAFYKSNLYPITVPTLAWTLTAMINTGEFVFSSQWAKRNVTFSMTAAETLWRIMHMPEAITCNDVCALVFDRAYPGDNVYDGVDYAAAMRTAEATRTERAEDELEFGRQAAVSMSTTHAQALVESEEYMSFETRRMGSLSNPRPPVRELSPSVRAALTRKRARNAAAAEIGAMPAPVAPVQGEVDVLGFAVDPNGES